MKTKITKLLTLLLACLACLACISCDTGDTDPKDETTAADTTAAAVEETTEAVTEELVDPATDGNVRVILASDLHYTTIETYYGVSTDARMQHFVDSVLWEHEQKPIDLLVIVGDTSLDHLFKRGTWTAEKVSTTLSLREKYLSQIKDAGIPIFTVPGNHEQFNNDQWNQFAGNDRYGAIAIEGNLFIMLDAFSVDLEPNYDFDPTYANHDVDYIKQQMALHPECDKVYLIAHYFSYTNESTAFKDLVREDDRIIGLFQGHTHTNKIIDMGAIYGNKIIAETGNFSQLGPNADMETLKKNFWGFRDLVITPESVITRYITVKSSITVNGVKFMDLNRTLSNSAKLY